jgi:predicted amidohydrolase
MKNLKIALGQMRVIPGQLTKNFETIVEFVQQAKQEIITKI